MEKMMENRLLLAVFVVVAVSAISTFSIVSYAATVTSGSLLLNVTDSAISINHTNNLFANISIGANTTAPAGANSSTVILINNISTTITANYSQPTLSNVVCGSGNAFRPAVANTTGWFNETVVANNTNQTVAIFLTTPQLACSPGRYFGYLNVTNSTNTSDFVTIEFTANIPITNSTSAFNTTSVGNHTGIYNGTLAAFAPEAHSYFFYTTAVKNATGVVINLTAANDVDLFVIDNGGVLQGKSITDGATKTVVTSFNDKDETWEIRLFGNRSSSTDYDGVIVFSTIDIVLANGTKTDSLKTVNHGTLRAGDNATLNVNITNAGEIPYTGINENRELRFVKTFGKVNQSSNYTILIPDSVTKIRASVNWTALSVHNITNYTLSLNAPNGTVINNSINNYLNANASNTNGSNSIELEEFIETTDIQQGLWNITVGANNTGILNNQTVIVNLFYNTTNRIHTNFSATSGNLSAVGVNNDSVEVYWNITVLNDTLPGSYEGFIEYAASNGATTRSGFKYTVQSASVVANQTFNSSTMTIEQNRGHGIYTFANFTLNNTGDLDTTLTSTNSSLALIHTSNSSSLVNFTYNITAGLTLSAGDNTTINITFNASPSVSTGMHVGWLFVNSTDSHPDQGFNLTLKMNVSDSLEVSITEILSNVRGNGTFETDNTKNQSFVDDNITVRTQVRYVNGTLLDDTIGHRDFSNSNFSIYMRHQNVTWTVPYNGSLHIHPNQSWFSGVGNPIYNAARDTFNISAMIFNDTDGNSLGGAYDVYFVTYLNATPTGPLYTGQAIFNNYTIDNASLFMSSNFSTCSIGSGCSTSTTLSGTQNVSINVTNFGTRPTSAIGTVTLNLSVGATCDKMKTATLSSASCDTATAGSGLWTIALGVKQSCYVSWNAIPITDGACSGTADGSQDNKWFSSSNVNISFTIDVDPAASSGSSSSSSSSGGGGSSSTTTTTASTTSATYLQIPQWKSIIEVGQGKSANSTVTVKNVNDTLKQTVSFSVIGLNSSITATATPKSAAIEAGETSDFVVDFTVPATTVVNEYPGKFQASSSEQTITADFTVHVLPGEAEKLKISSDFDVVRQEVLDLWAEINSTKSLGGNLTATDDLFAQVKSKLDEAEAQLALGTDQGYFQANQLIKEIRNLLDTTKAQLKVDKQGSGFLFPVDPLYIGIGIAVAVAGFLVYLFLPTKGLAAKIPKITKPGTSGAHSHSDHSVKFKPSFRGLKKFNFYGTKGHVKDAASSAKDAAGSAKDATKGGIKKLKDKLKLKKEYKYRYDE